MPTKFLVAILLLTFLMVGFAMKLIIPSGFTSTTFIDSIVATKISMSTLDIFTVIDIGTNPTASSPTNANRMQRLYNNGIKVLGSVDMAQCAVSESDLKSIIDSWVQFYGQYIYGFLLDDLLAQNTCTSLVQAISDYIHSKTLRSFGNQKSISFTGFQDILDVLIIYEGESYPSGLKDLASLFARSTTGLIVTSQNLIEETLKQTCSNIDYVFITDSPTHAPFTSLGSQFQAVAFATDALYYSSYDNSCYYTTCPANLSSNSSKLMVSLLNFFL